MADPAVNDSGHSQAEEKRGGRKSRGLGRSLRWRVRAWGRESGAESLGQRAWGRESGAESLGRSLQWRVRAWRCRGGGFKTQTERGGIFMWLSSQPANLWEYGSESWRGKRNTHFSLDKQTLEDRKRGLGKSTPLKKIHLPELAKCGIWRGTVACPENSRHYCKQGPGVWNGGSVWNLME